MAALRRHAGDGAVALARVSCPDLELVAGRFGATAGRALVAELSRRLRAVTRAGDVVAELEGAEFAVVAGELDGGGEAAEALGRRVRTALKEPVSIGEALLVVDVDVGVALTGAVVDADGLLRQAEAALHQSRARQGAVVVHSSGVPDPVEERLLAARLHHAISAGELLLHYQPVFELEAGSVRGVEALVRWRDPARGLVPPAAFIPAAERAGMIDRLGDWVLRESCRQAAEWAADGLFPRVGVNLSPGQLAEPELADRIAATAAAHRLDPAQLVLELTETAWTLHPERLLPALEQLREHGFVLAIDDFGAGYSSLWRLRELPADVIKIDRTLLRAVPEDPQATAVLEAVITLARTCRCDVVAEGIETEAQRAFLISRACPLGQGYALARPQPAAAVGELLRARMSPGRRAPALAAGR